MAAPFANVRILGVSEAVSKLERLGTDSDKELASKVRAATILVQGAIKREASGGTIGGAKTVERSGGIRRASGKLAQSWTLGFEIARHRFIGRVGSPLAYSRIHETGGVIRPVKKRYLTIPLTARAAKMPAPEFGGLRFVASRDSAVLLDASGRAQYVLRKSVMIPARRYVTVAIQKSARQRDKILGEAIDVSLRKFGQGEKAGR
jgi:phage gpG-like protein